MMSKRVVTSILLLFFGGIGPAFSQNYAGYWLGVTYPSDPNSAIFNYFGNFTQSGNTLGGTAQTANPLVAFGGLAYVKGTVTATTVKFKESESNGSLNTPLTCYWSLDLKYDPVEESLKGTYANIQNPPYCDEKGGGKVELYRIVLKSGNKYCKGQPINLTVTGKDIRWYDSASKSRMVAQGNQFSPPITQTTTYYITQTLYNTESPAIPIKIEIVDVAIADIKAENPSCGQPNGKLTVLATGSADLQYSLDGNNYQLSNVFDKLSGGEFTVSVKDATGCAATKKVALIQPGTTKITDVQSLPTTCGKEDGGITVTTTATSAQFSIDGSKFQPGAAFRNLAAGDYTVTMKDAAGCTDTRAVTVAASEVLKISDIETKPATCGKQDGTLTIDATGGKGLQYSVDGGSTFQASPQFTGLMNSPYKVQVKNAAGCITEREAELKGDATPTISDIKTQNPTCGETNGQLIVIATGAGLIQYSLDGTNYQQSNVFDKLIGGDFSVSVKDEKGCAATKKTSLQKSSAVKISSAQATPTTCGETNGGIIITTDAIDVQYSVDGKNFQPSATFRNMKAETYKVTMRDALGCSDTRTVTVAASSGPSLEGIDLTPVSCGVADGRVVIRASGNNLQYAMNAGSFGTGNYFENLLAGEYEVAIRDAKDCVVLHKVKVRSDCANTIFVPTSFSPNGDGQNDQLTVHFPFPSLQFSSLRVYNRWGIAVFGNQDQILSNGDAIWDGKIDGQTPVTENYFVVVAEVMFEDGSSHTFRKEVMVLR